MSTKEKKKMIIAILLYLAILAAGCIDNYEPENDDSIPEIGTYEKNITIDSLETCLNSRISYHKGWSGEAPEDWTSYVLRAADRAPVTGNYRNIYVTLPEGRYLYDTDTGMLTNKEPGSSGDAAFFLSFDRDLDFDAGTSYMFAILASVSLWDGTESQITSIPMQKNLYFGMRDIDGVTTELKAVSSDGSLPDPMTIGNNSVEEVINDLKYNYQFANENVMTTDLSQILWAGYGCTPHTTYNGRAGLTVPSWRAEYYLTENIYVVNQDGVYRYHNRKPSGDLDTRDHRIELIQAGDIRPELQSSLSELPVAPCYIILCLDKEDVDKWYARLETGFVAGNMLLQTSALDMGCFFNTQLNNSEQDNIKRSIGIEKSDIPHAIVSIGYTRNN